MYAASEEDRQTLEELDQALGLAGAGDEGKGSAQPEDWVVVTSQDADTGLTFGIARPIRQSLAQIRRTAARNFGYGMGLILLAVVGILPLSGRLTRDLQLLNHHH